MRRLISFVCFFSLWAASSVAVAVLEPKVRSAQQGAKDFRNYSLYLNSNSRYIDIGDGKKSSIAKATRLSNSETFAENAARTRKHAEQVVAQIINDHNTGRIAKAPGSAKVVIFVHGGLNTITDGLKRIESRTQAMLKAGYHPVFINWRSGLISSYWEHLGKWRVDQAQSSRNHLLFLVPNSIRDLISTVADAPTVWTNEGVHAVKAGLRGPGEFGLNSAELAGSVYENQIQLPSTAKPKRQPLRIAKWWLTSPVKLITTPFVGSLGSHSWDEMRNRSLSTGNQSHHVADGKPNCDSDSAEDCEIDNTPSICPAGHLDPSFAGPANALGTVTNPDCANRGIVTLFIETLVQALNQEGLEHALTLAGHSMGSIVVNDIIRDLPQLPVKTLVHLASADRVDRVIETQTRYIARNPKTKAFNLYLHPRNEDREVRVNGLVPSGSILVWIDNMFTNPSVPRERTAGRWDNMGQELHRYPVNVASQVFHRVFEIEERSDTDHSNAIYQCNPEKHTEFPNCPFWEEQFLFQPKPTAKEEP